MTFYFHPDAEAEFYKAIRKEIYGERMAGAECNL
jgi:hypothetical protein